jgi:hypothetical protein
LVPGGGFEWAEAVGVGLKSEEDEGGDLRVEAEEEVGQDDREDVGGLVFLGRMGLSKLG